MSVSCGSDKLYRLLPISTATMSHEILAPFLLMHKEDFRYLKKSANIPKTNQLQILNCVFLVSYSGLSSTAGKKKGSLSQGTSSPSYLSHHTVPEGLDTFFQKA